MEQRTFHRVTLQLLHEHDFAREIAATRHRQIDQGIHSRLARREEPFEQLRIE